MHVKPGSALALAAVLAALACEPAPTDPTPDAAAAGAPASGAFANPKGSVRSIFPPGLLRRRLEHAIVGLTGAEEVPPRETPAFGTTKLVVEPGKDAIHYRLATGPIENAFAAHIHLGPPGVNGPIIAFLAGPFPPGGGLSRGILGAGEITAEDLIGPLAGQPLSALLAEMRAGNTYVNVHTNDGVDPPNTGPGDFPGGEIRGQIELVSPQR
jgi:hypothetical protein